MEHRTRRTLPTHRDPAAARDHLTAHLGPQEFAELLDRSVLACRIIDQREGLRPQLRAALYRCAVPGPAPYLAGPAEPDAAPCG
jgi:hypothetical protein